MITRNFRFILDNPKVLKKRQVLERSSADFNEVNVLFNLSSALANDRLSQYLQELIGRTKDAIDSIETGSAFGDLIASSYQAHATRDTKRLVEPIIEFFGRRAKLQATIFYEPAQLMWALDKLQKKFVKTPYARAVKKDLLRLRESVDAFFFAMGETLFESYPSWFLEFVVLLGYELQLNRNICGDEPEVSYDFMIALHYAYEAVSTDSGTNPTSIEFAVDAFADEEKCFEIFCAKKLKTSKPCEKSGCEGVYRYPIKGRRVLACDVEGCRDQLSPCVGTFFEGRKGRLGDWYLGLLYLQRSGWIGASDRWNKRLVRDKIGRKRFDEVIRILADEQVASYNELHEPDMVRMPTTGLLVDQNSEDGTVTINSFAADSEFKHEFSKPKMVGYTVKK